MISLNTRSLLGTQFWRRLSNSTYRRSTSPASDNGAPNVYKNKNECLVINWRDGHVDEFPYVYLRENCRCPGCYTDERKSRTMYSPKEVDLDITVESFSWNSEHNKLEVNWGDGHISRYSLKWLNYLRYCPPGEDQPDGVLRKGIKLWGPEMSKEGSMPTFQFEELLNDEKELYKWLVTLVTRTGIAKVENAQKEKGQLRILGQRVGYLMQTSYGLLPEVKAFSEHSTHEVGYSDSYLPIHSDYSFNQIVPMVGMFHCIEQTKSEGGANLWVDAFHAANLLFEEDPELFEALVNTPVLFCNFTKTMVGKVYGRSRHPLIRLDHDKKVQQTCYSDEFRHNHMPLEPKLMKSFYKAYYRYSELLADKRTFFWHKMMPGDIMTINNYRVLHGRSEFNDRSDNVRILELGYFDWDCVYSKIRILAEKQKMPSPVD